MASNWGIFLVIVTLCATGYSQGLKRLVACSQELVQIECDPGESIAVHDAIFYANQSEACGLLLPVNLSSLVSHEQSFINWTDPVVRKYSVQSAFNKRCSGRSNCTFLLNDDEPQAKSWANGKVYLHYSCISSKSIIHSCGETIEISSEVVGTTENPSSRPSWMPGPISVAGSGYIKNGGYPEHYRGNSNSQDCRWTLRVTQGRRVRLQLLDLSIRSEPNCTDALVIQENQTVLFNKCGELDEPLTIESQSNSLNVTLVVKTKFFPKRGLLIYFTAIGCPTPTVPKHGHLIYRNETHAQFMCHVDHFFPDTRMKDRNLTCQEGHRWSDRVPDCVDGSQADETGNQSRNQISSNIRNHFSDPKAGQLTDYSVTFDLIIPTAIIAGLILGNIVIVIAVFQCRRRRTREAKDTEESVPLQNNPGPSDVQTDQRTGTPV